MGRLRRKLMPALLALSASHALALTLLTFTAPDGEPVEVNPAEVSSVREPREAGAFHGNVRCVLFMTNGRFIPLGEPCAEVSRRLLR